MFPPIWRKNTRKPSIPQPVIDEIKGITIRAERLLHGGHYFNTDSDEIKGILILSTRLKANLKHIKDKNLLKKIFKLVKILDKFEAELSNLEKTKKPEEYGAILSKIHNILEDIIIMGRKIIR